MCLNVKSFVSYSVNNFNCLIVTIYIYVIQENVEALLAAVRQELGFSQGKPVATFIIYKSLLHWKYFEADKTNVFDRLIQMIGSAIEVRLNSIFFLNYYYIM